MYTKTPYATLKQIQNRDPDGWEMEPMDSDYHQFKFWVINTYGQQAWNDYNASNWAPVSDV